MKSIVMVFGLIVLATLAMGGTGQQRQAPPPRSAAEPKPRAIPGITEKDLFPGGCVDCHVHRPDLNVDGRFSTFMKQFETSVDPRILAKAQAAAPQGVTLKGRHPKVALGNVPASCMRCHAKTSKTAPPFARMLHSIHLTGGSENHFLTIFQGECTHCHKLNAKTGEWSLPSGLAN